MTTVKFKDDNDLEDTSQTDRRDNKYNLQKDKVLKFIIKNTWNKGGTIVKHWRDSVNKTKIESQQQKSLILVMDTAANQCTCRGNAWIITNTTRDQVCCIRYIQHYNKSNGHILPITSTATCVSLKGREPFIWMVHQAYYHKYESYTESLCLPYQAEQNGVRFRLAPREREDSIGILGQQNMTIEDKIIPLEFDGRKMYLPIHRST